jgi:hypothetical protein
MDELFSPVQLLLDLEILEHVEHIINSMPIDEFQGDLFLPEIKKQPVKSLSELNDLYFAWKNAEYDNSIHSCI